MYDAVIIGGGVAGLSAAVYAARAGKNVIVLEGKICGGQIVNSPKVSNYPGIKEISGYDLAISLYEQALSCGALVDYKNVTGIMECGDYKEVTADGETIQCKKIIIATGASHRSLGIKEEEKLVGKGVSYCAYCDGAFFKEKNVAVVGGGNTALMDAAYLSDICEKVYLIHRRDEFRGKDGLLETLKERENVEIITDSVVTKLNAEDMLESISVKNLKSNEEREIPVSGIFVAVGQVPDTKAFEGLIDMDKYGYIIANESLETNINGIYAAGDCRTKEVRQLITAAADGAVAGTKI